MMIAVSSGLAEAGTAAADLALLEEEEKDNPEPFSDEIEHHLKKLQDYGDWEARARTLLRTSSDIANAPNPAGGAISTHRRQISVIRYVLETCKAVGIPVDDFNDLQSTDVLNALEARVDPAKAIGAIRSNLPTNAGCNGFPLPATWSGVYFNGNLRAIRTILHARGLAASEDLSARIRAYDASERRDDDYRLFRKETYLAGAAALDAFGRIALAAGRREGHSIRTGAVLLAVAADGSPRRSEVGLADRRLVHNNHLSSTPEVKIFVRRSASKVREPRTLWLTDPRAIRMISLLRTREGGFELFRKADGTPLTLPALDALLRKVTKMALGQPATYNLLRRANADAYATKAERAMRLGQVPGSHETDGTYHRTFVQKSGSVLAAARARAQAAAEGPTEFDGYWSEKTADSGTNQEQKFTCNDSK